MSQHERENASVLFVDRTVDVQRPDRGGDPLPGLTMRRGISFLPPGYSPVSNSSRYFFPSVNRAAWPDRKSRVPSLRPPRVAPLHNTVHARLAARPGPGHGGRWPDPRRRRRWVTSASKAPGHCGCPRRRCRRFPSPRRPAERTHDWFRRPRQRSRPTRPPRFRGTAFSSQSGFTLPPSPWPGSPSPTAFWSTTQTDRPADSSALSM